MTEEKGHERKEVWHHIFSDIYNELLDFTFTSLGLRKIGLAFSFHSEFNDNEQEAKIQAHYYVSSSNLSQRDFSGIRHIICQYIIAERII